MGKKVPSYARVIYRPTTANFTRCEVPARPCDRESRSGSRYWYEEEGLYRESDHWGMDVRSCDWFLEGCAYGFGSQNTRVALEGGLPTYVCVPFLDGDGSAREPLCGFCPWGEFVAK